MYLDEILFLMAWPAIITLSYWLVILTLKRYEKMPHREEKEGPDVIVVD